jgi:predicted kinase
MEMRDRQPLLLLVTGPPGAGKSTLASRLASDLRLPLVAKDEIKEVLADQLGTGDLDWSRRLGGATYELLWLTMARLIEAGAPFIAECNFDRDLATETIAQMLHERPHRVVQVVCRTPPEVLQTRLVARAKLHSRHPIHDDLAILAQLDEALARDAYGPMALPGEAIEIDTSHAADSSYLRVLSYVGGLPVERATG